MAELLDRVLHHEGFETKPYQDHLGIWTFGHGLTFITEEESKTIVDARITDYLLRIVQTHDWLLRRPKDVTEVLVEMCYQLGWTGCHNFKKMWAALENEDYEIAANEMLDSKWAIQTPTRALELAQIIRNLI